MRRKAITNKTPEVTEAHVAQLRPLIFKHGELRLLDLMQVLDTDAVTAERILRGKRQWAIHRLQREAEIIAREKGTAKAPTTADDGFRRPGRPKLGTFERPPALRLDEPDGSDFL